MNEEIDINDFLNNSGYMLMNKKEHNDISINDNLLLNKYYDVEKLNYDIVEKKTDEYSDYMEKTQINMKYLEWFYNKDYMKGIEWYETYRSDIPFIERIGYYLVRKDLDNPIKKYEKNDLKKIMKDHNKNKKKLCEENRLKILKQKNIEKKKIKINNGKYVIKF